MVRNRAVHWILLEKKERRFGRWELRIRKATLDDLDAIERIEALCFPASEAAARESLRARLTVYPDHFLVLEDGGELIGFVNGMVTDERTISDAMFDHAELHREDGRWQSVFGLDVVPGHRRKGHAERLMRAFIELARSESRLGCILTCKERLLPYYAKFGFKNEGVSQSQHGGAVWYDMTLTFDS